MPSPKFDLAVVLKFWIMIDLIMQQLIKKRKNKALRRDDINHSFVNFAKLIFIANFSA